MLLFTSPTAKAGTVEGSAVQGEEDGGIRCMGATPQKEMKRLASGGVMRRNAFTRNN